jgi:Fe-S cluster assembly iron-binding protein IscA
MQLNVSENALSELNKIIEEKKADKNIRIYIAGVG